MFYKRIRLLDLLISKIKESELVRSVLTLSVGTSISQLIPILASLVLARLYSPEQYGDWGIFLSYTTILSIIMCGRYEYAILRPKKETDAFNLVILSFLICASLSIIIFIIWGFFAVFNLTSLNSIPSFGWISLYLFLSGVMAILTNYSNRVEHYKFIAYSSVTRSVFQSLSRISLGILKVPGGLILGAVVGLAGSVIPLIRSISTKNVKRSISPKALPRLASEYKKFPIFEIPSGVLNAMSTSIPTLLIASFFMKDYVGYFTMSIQLLFLPMSFLGAALGQVFYKKSCAWKTDRHKIAELAKKIFKFTFFLGMVPVLFLIFGAEPIFSALLSSKWQTAGEYSFYMSLWVWAVLCFSPLSTILWTYDKQKINMVMNLCMLILRILAIFAGGYYFQSMNLTVLFYGVSGLVLWVIEGVILWRIIGIKMSFKEGAVVCLSFIAVLIMWIFKVCMKFN